MNYKMIIAYDGSRYNGWQKQNNTKDTIQGKLERLLQELTGEHVEVQGAGRTDAGVHAQGQVASFQLLTEVDSLILHKSLCERLPEDIAVLSLEKASERFHARLNSTGKEYCYRIYLSQESPVFLRKYLFHHPEPLHIDTMKKTAVNLLGTHDFAIFNDNKKFKKSTQRTIYSIDFQENNALLEITFTGDGFLYHMVRKMMGMLIHSGETGEVIDTIFELDKFPAHWPLAPAKGLILKKVLY